MTDVGSEPKSPERLQYFPKVIKTPLCNFLD
jgi:hypothetical protein